MEQIIQKAISKDGHSFDFVLNDDPPCGSMKYVYFSPDKNYVVAFFRKTPDAKEMSRLECITGKYRNEIIGQEGGDCWKDLFCWPEKIVEWDGKIGVVLPVYAKHFFFQYDKNLAGREKEGKWFASAKLFRKLDLQERGDFHSYLNISLKLARAVGYLHAAGLADADLSYKNVLIDPFGANTCIINIMDELIIPGYSPDVLGTPDFIAPEILCDKTNSTLPSILTNRHSLAVLIYMFLLHRHPLRGGRFFGQDVDPEEDELRLMGTQPLYIEHPTDKSNRNMKREYGDDFEKSLPWVDLDKFSAEKIAGPFLAGLFRKAFIDGIKAPEKRPHAEEWEQAIIKTKDMLIQCSNPECPGKWFVSDGTQSQCPFCGTGIKGEETKK